MKKWAKILAIGIGGALVLVAVLVIAAFHLLQTDFAQRRLQGKITEIIPGAVAWGSLSVSITSGTIELKDAILRGPDGQDLIGLDRLYLDLALSRLFRGELVVDQFTLDAPRADLRVDPAGRLNLTDAFPPSGETEPDPPKTNSALPFNVIVRSAKITNGSVQYRMDGTEGNGRHFGAADINTTLSCNLLAGTGELSLNLGQITTDPHGAAGVPAEGKIDRIRLDMRMKEQLLTLDPLAIDAASGHLSLTGAVDLGLAFPDGVLGESGDLETLSFELRLQGDGIAIEKLVKLESELSGLLSSSIHIKGKGISPGSLAADATIEITATGLRARGISEPVDAHLTAAASMLDGIASLDRILATLGEAELTSEAQFGLRDQSIRANLILSAPDLSQSLSPLGMGEVKGGFHLETNVSGSLEVPELDIRLAGSNLGFGEIQFGNATLVSSLKPSGFLEIERLALENQGSELTGHGRILILEDGRKPSTRLPMDLTLKIADLEAQDFVKAEIADGTLNGNLAVSGDLNALEATVSLDAEQVAVEAARIGDIHLEANLVRGTLFVDALQVTNNRSELNIQGKAEVLAPEGLSVLPSPTFDFKVTGDEIFAEDFTDQLKGEFSLNASIGGSPEHPEGTLVLNGRDIDLGMQTIHRIAVSSKLKDREVILESFTINLNEKESLAGRGKFLMPDSYEIEIESQGISLSSIDQVKDQKIAEGQIALSLKGEGQLDNPSLTGEITIRDLSINQKKVDDFSINLDVKDKLARIAAQMGFHLEADYHLAHEDFHGTIVFNETDLNPYLRIAGQEDFTGELSGRITASGNVRNPRALNATAAIDRLSVFFQGRDLVATRDALLQVENETFSVSNLNLALLKEGSLDVTGRGALKGPLDLRIEGVLPVSAANIFLEDMDDADGKIVLRAGISGDLSEPDIRGTIGFQNVQMTVPVLLQKLHSLNGELEISPDAVVIRDLDGRLDTGGFSIGGEIALSKFQPSSINVDLAVNTLPVKVPDTLDMLLTSEIQISGNTERSVVKGDLIILEGVFYKDIDLGLSNVLGGKSRKGSAAPSRVENPFLKNMELDLHVRRRNPFLVDNNLAYLDINPDLKITGTVYAPSIGGRATIESGTVLYQKKSFSVKKGVIDFLNPYAIEPTLDLENEVTIRDWVISLAISGTPDAMIFELSSDPPEEDGDILSLLLIGKTTRELIAGEGGSSQSPSQILSGLVAATLGEKVKQSTGLDVFELEGAGSENVKITIGKELSRRLMVKYATDMKEGENVQRAIGEYKLMDHILLNGFQDTTGVFGGEIQFRLEFR